jgi:transcriptional regulator NrdR family protein
MVIVKKDGRLQDFDDSKLLKSIGSKYKAVECVNIINQIKKQLNTTRFKEFYPNTHNIQDLVEKYILLNEKNELPDS